MIGSIEDVRVHIEPSNALVQFICKLAADQPMPENIVRIRATKKIKTETKEFHCEHIAKRLYTREQRELMKQISSKDEFAEMFSDVTKLEDILNNKTNDEDHQQADGNQKANNKVQLHAGKNTNDNAVDVLLNINDLRWIDQALERLRADEDCDTYLHELLAESKVVLPKNRIIPRNPELEARCVKLREEQLERDYRSMTKDVDATRQHLPEDTIAFQMKSINRQLVAVFQFVVSVITGFVFGFIGLQYMFGDLDFGFRLFMGIMCALIIALAEIYFLAKKLAEYDELVDDLPIPKPKAKPHQD